MKYKIATVTMGSQLSLEISPEEYSTIRGSKRNLVILTGIEEKFDILLENYAEYERSLLDLALHQMLFRDLDWPSFRADVKIVNRRLTNVLSAARLYVDQVKHDLSTIYASDPTPVEAVTKSMSQEYDTNLGYKAMEAVRNHIQHRSLPVDRMSYPTSLMEPDAPASKMRFRVVPCIDTVRLEADSKFKGSALSELKSMGHFVPLTPLVRQYVEGLGRVHDTLRKGTAGDVAEWEATIAAVEARATAAEGQLPVGLAVVKEDDDNEGIWVETDEMFGDLAKYRQSLVRKNGSLDRLSRRYVSGEAEEDDAGTPR
jgi:hypothetical protein